MPPEYRARGHRGVLALVLLGFLAAACAPMKPGPRGVGTRTYGRCSVTTLPSGPTEETRHGLTCLGFSDESPKAKQPSMILHCSVETSVVLLLHPGKTQFHPAKLIKVRYRFNQHAPVEKNWFWSQEEQGVGTLSHATIDDFLRGVAARERLVFEVGDRAAAISFTGDTTGAINDFQSRCAALKNKRAPTPAPLRQPG